MTNSLVLTDGSPAEMAARLPAGPVVILGGPGSGKTALLEAVVAADGAAAGRPLFLAASRGAADQTRDRLLTRPDVRASTALRSMTWHSFARAVVSASAAVLEYRGEPRVLDAREQWSLVRALVHDARIDWGALADLTATRAFTEELVALINMCERAGVDADMLEARALAEGRPAWRAAAALLRHYGDQLALADQIDAGGLLVQAACVLADIDALTRAHGAVSAVVVDDAEELDSAQLHLLRQLAGANVRMVLAGDPSGSTHAQAGAVSEALAGHAVLLGAAVVELRHSRRLGGAGLEAVRRLQLAGSIRPVALVGGRSTEVQILRFGGPAEEALEVARLLRLTSEREGVPYGRMAILAPSLGAVRAQLGRALEHYDVPHRLASGEHVLTEETPVRQILDLFRLATDRATAPELVPNLLASPLGRLDRGELRVVRRAAVVADVSLEDLVLSAAPPGDLQAPLRERILEFRTLCERTTSWSTDRTVDKVLWEVWKAVPAFQELVDVLKRDPAAPGAERRLDPHRQVDAHRQLDALAAFSCELARFVEARPQASVASYLDVVDGAAAAGSAWVPPAVGADDAVSLLRADAAKGREFDIVVVTGCLEGALPRSSWPGGLFESWRLLGAGDHALQSELALESERRRFTLAASRARDRVIFTFSRSPGRSEPSRFLAELGVPIPAEPSSTDTQPLSAMEAAGALRRVAADVGRAAPERLAAATELAALREVDPGTWWWRLDWTHDPEPLAEDGSLRSSYSRIGTYEDCHLRYFYSSAAGLDDRTSHQMAFGSLMHLIFEKAARDEIPNEPVALKAEFRERFERNWFPSRAVAHRYWRDGMKMLGLWFSGEARLAARAVAIETSFEIEVGRHVVRGRIDRVDSTPDGIILVDYKTSRSPATKEQAEESLQLAIYYLAALRDPELAKLGPPVRMELAYPAKATRDGQFYRVAQEPGEDSAADVEARLLGLLDGAAAEDFEPDPHAECRFCAFKPICPMWPQGEEFLGPVRTPDLAARP